MAGEIAVTAHKNRRVDLIRLQAMVDQGLSGREMARLLGVSPPAISRNLKALNIARGQDAVLNCAKKINQNYLSVMDRARRNAQIVGEELDHLNEKIRTAGKEERVPLIKSRLEHVAEDRKLSDSLVSAARAMVHIDQVMILQRAVEKIFEKLSAEKKEEFLAELRKLRSLNSTIGSVDRDSI
jgi:DNA-binding MarR family transcriptional regulator